jgi:hypothetical protein
MGYMIRDGASNFQMNTEYHSLCVWVKLACMLSNVGNLELETLKCLVYTFAETFLGKKALELLQKLKHDNSHEAV